VHFIVIKYSLGGRRGPNSMIVGFTTICPISAYHY